MFLRLRRRLWGIPEPAISREQAIALAREECERAGYPWEEPIRFVEHPRYYGIVTPIHRSGGNVCIHVDAQTGEARVVGVVPR
jgi:hypothetical protein